MNHFAKGVLTAASLATLLSLPVVGQAGQAPSSAQHRRQNDPPAEPVVCDNRAPRVNAVKLKLADPAVPLSATVDFDNSLGAGIGGEAQFDPIPLLETKIYVGGKKSSCVIAHFSAQVTTLDNTVVFQASIDDIPMEGHGLYPTDLRAPQITNPIVMAKGLFHSPTVFIPVPTMASYNFFQIVKPGWHTVKIKWASCCTLSSAVLPTAEALAAALTVEYQGKLNNYEHDDD